MARVALPVPVSRAALAALLLCLSACASLQPQKLTEQEVADRIRTDQAEIYRGQDSIDTPVTFPVALARALKYNLDYRLKLMEGALSRGVLDTSALDLLPKLVVDAGYQSRSNDSGGTSIGIEDRQQSLRPSTSEQRAHAMGRAELSWNALDFGLSYYRARQAADEYNISDERRRKILQNIVQDVRNAYWRAVGAQRLAGEAETLRQRIQEALERSRQAESAGLLPATQSLAYQRALLDAMSLVNAKRQEMEFAKRELAALMNVTPGAGFTLAEAAEMPLAPVPGNLDELELMALQNRPELREEDYRARIGQNETRKQLASLFPSLNFYVGSRYDSNRYLYNESWAETGVNLSFNLFRLASIPAIQRTNEARKQADDARRMALSMAVVTQLRVSLERYRLAEVDYQLSQEATRIDQRLASVSRASTDSRLESELEALRTESRALVSRFQQASAYAAAQAAHGRILNSLGIDLLPESVRATDIPALATAIEAHMKAGEREAFLIAPTETQTSRPLAVRISGLPTGTDAAVVRSAVERALARNQVQVGMAADIAVLSLHFSPAAAPAPGQASARATWHVQLTDAAGVTRVDRRYQGFVPRQTTDRTVAALAEAATLATVVDVQQALIERKVALP
jgi:outer membrane protein TolC